MSIKRVIDHYIPYISNLIIIWVVIIFYKKFPYYHSFLSETTQTTLLILALTYTILAFIYYTFTRQETMKPTKGLVIIQTIKRLTKGTYYSLKYIRKKQKFPKIKAHEKIIILFAIVKIFFLPIMLNFFFSNLNSVISLLDNLSSLDLSLIIESFNLIIFPILLTTMFLIDTLWFVFGYAFESSSLKNTIKTVEPTIFGWLVALACYPPLNGIITQYLDWYANDYVTLGTPLKTFILRIFILSLILIYVGATLALGTKCSNLTNRGIVKRGPYKFIRHPAYISKNLAWWLTILPVLSIAAVISMGTWSIIYHLRTLTEERHLSNDPDYIEYMKKVKYRYIPGVY